MFHGGTVISTLATQLVACQLQLFVFFFPAPPLPSRLSSPESFFFFFLHQSQSASAANMHTVHRRYWLNKYTPFCYSLLWARPICGGRFPKQSGTKREICSGCANGRSGRQKFPEHANKAGRDGAFSKQLLAGDLQIPLLWFLTNFSATVVFLSYLIWGKGAAALGRRLEWKAYCCLCLLWTLQSFFCLS